MSVLELSARLGSIRSHSKSIAYLSLFLIIVKSYSV